MVFDELYEDLLVLASHIGTRPDVPIESEVFFSQIVEGFQGSKEECLAYIEKQLPLWFRRINQSPAWVQDAEWQFSNGKPMIFIGQTDVPRSSGLFHDDSCFYIFYDAESGETKTVIQLY